MAERTQAERRAATRAALLAAGRKLFGERGYAAVGTEQIVSESGLTRGALYHHFDGKLGLFRAIYEQIEAELVERIAAEELSADDPLDVLRTGVRVVLSQAVESDVQRIALVDAPAVLGYEEWRAIEEEHGLGLLTGALTAAIEAGQIREQPVEPLAHGLLGAIIVGAQYVARAEDVERARGEMEKALVGVLDGLMA